MIISWSAEKDEILLLSRGVSFEMVRELIEAGNFSGPEINPARPGQFRIIVELNSYPHIVPMVIDEDGVWYLKTIYPSRKYKRRQ